MLHFDQITTSEKLYWYGLTWTVIMATREMIWLRDDSNPGFTATLTREEYETAEIEPYVNQDIHLIKVDGDGTKTDNHGNIQGSDLSGNLRSPGETPDLQVSVRGESTRPRLPIPLDGGIK